MAAAALTVATAVAALILLSGDDGDPGATAGAGPQPTATVAATPTPAARPVRVGRTIRNVGFRPRDAAVVDGHVWVISNSRERITSIDAESGRVSGPQPLVGRGAAAIARDRDVVWVAGRTRGAVLGVSPRTGDVVREIATPLPPIRLTAGASGLWVVGRAAPLGPAVLLRYDREGLELLEQHEFASGITDIALGGGFLWVGLEQERRVMRIAPDAEPEHGAWLTAPPTALAYGAGYVWASVAGDDSVARIDPRSKLTVTTIAGRRPQQLVVAHGRVFVASNTNHRIVFLHRKTGERLGSPLRVPPNPYAMAAGAGHVWVTGVGTSTLTRLDP